MRSDVCPSCIPQQEAHTVCSLRLFVKTTEAAQYDHRHRLSVSNGCMSKTSAPFIEENFYTRMECILPDFICAEINLTLKRGERKRKKSKFQLCPHFTLNAKRCSFFLFLFLFFFFLMHVFYSSFLLCPRLLYI